MEIVINIKKQIVALTVCLLLTGGCLQSMEPEKKLIEFKGEKKPLLAWIAETLQSEEPAEHPFSVTAVIRLKDNKFVLQGDILNINDQDRKDIDNNNYVYCPLYSTQKTRVNPATYEGIGAIILGTNNKDVCYDLALATVHGMLSPLKKTTIEQEPTIIKPEKSGSPSGGLIGGVSGGKRGPGGGGHSGQRSHQGSHGGHGHGQTKQKQKTVIVGTKNNAAIRKLLDVIEELSHQLVQGEFSTQWIRISDFVLKRLSVVNNFKTPMKVNDQPDMQAINKNLTLITECEDSIKIFKTDSALAKTVKPNAWPVVDGLLTALSELRQLVEAENQ